LFTRISFSSTFQQGDDQKCVHAMVDVSYESVDQNSSDMSCKNIIVGEGDQKKIHDTFSQTHLSFDHYQDNDVKVKNILFLFFQKLLTMIGQHIIMMNSDYRDVVKGSRKVHISS